MTEEQINKMMDDEIDFLLGKNVMGWTAAGAAGFLERDDMGWQPTEYLDDATEAIEKALGPNFWLMTGRSWNGAPQPYFAQLREKKDSNVVDISYAYGRNRARAACNALCLVIKAH
jgi:hypothetical protein